MKNKAIMSKLEALEKISMDLISTVNKEVKQYEDIINKNKLEPLEYLFLKHLDIRFKRDGNEASIVVSLTQRKEDETLSNAGLTGFYKERYGSAFIYDYHMKNYKKFKKENLIEILSNYITKLYEREIETHLKNVSISNNNLTIYNGLMDMISELGFTKSYVGYKTARHKTRQRLDYNFTSELRAQVPIYSTSENGFENVRDTVIKKATEVVNEMDKYLKEKYEQYENEKQNELFSNPNYIFDVLSIVNGVKEFSEDAFDYMPEVPSLDKLKSRLLVTKYLIAGYHLEYNRNFMEEGTTHAEKAVSILLEELKTTTDSKQKEVLEKVIESISKVINDYDFDGRVFRDMEYNYDIIYEMTGLKGNYYKRYIPFVKKLVDLEYKYKK